MRKTQEVDEPTIAYFSMEVALSDEIPTFSGGLGVLAGDFLRSTADAGVPVVAVTLLYRQGFFRQEVDETGRQIEHPVAWSPGDHLESLDTRVTVPVGGRSVVVGVWRRELIGVSGEKTTLYFLDTFLPENAAEDQQITDRLYSSGPKERLAQEAVLGMAGPAMLSALGYSGITVFHLNEGHASLVPVALLADRVTRGLADATPADIDAVRERCVFTTHTPVPAGHDRFSAETTEEILGIDVADGLRAIGCLEREELNMTVLGMYFSRFVNGVAQRHREVAQAMFPTFRVEGITNGVHVATWAAPSTARLFDRHLPGWRQDNTMIRYAGGIPIEEIATAHAESKRVLQAEVARRCNVRLDPSALTICVARRAASYKRNDLLLSDPDALRDLAARVGPIEVVYSGKAHPSDEAAKALLARVVAAGKALAGAVTVVYLADYGMSLAAMLVAGVDVWLNNPVAPYEASGTSGMKAALNGVPSLSVLDGWWIEGCIEGVTGWAIGSDRGAAATREIDDHTSDASDAAELLRTLGQVIAPLFFEEREAFTAIRRSAISLNGSFFTTQRMVAEYAARAYRRSERTGDRC